MGNRPSTPSNQQAEALNARRQEFCARAASAIANADVLIVCTGAGWSADSGLAVYRDVADVAAYHERNLTYRDICQPHFIDEDPALFFGFWGGCFNDYRNVRPHEGYAIIRRWVERGFRKTEAAKILAAALRERLVTAAAQSASARSAHENAEAIEVFGALDAAAAADKASQAVASAKAEAREQIVADAFFCFTSNVDAHWLSAGFGQHEVHEIHGNCETWQCACACTDLRWPAPPNYRFHVDDTSRLAAVDAAPSVAATGTPGTGKLYDSSAFSTNWPTCVACHGLARPAVLMFGDSSYVEDGESDGRFHEWGEALRSLAPTHHWKVCVLEVGCGGNVTTVRSESETLVSDLSGRGVDVSLVRINPELPLADGVENEARVLPILSTGLAAIKEIDALLPARLNSVFEPSAGSTNPFASATGGEFAHPLEGFELGVLSQRRPEDAEEDEGNGVGGGGGGGGGRGTSLLSQLQSESSSENAAAKAKLDAVRAMLARANNFKERMDMEGNNSSGAAGSGDDPEEGGDGSDDDKMATDEVSGGGGKTSGASTAGGGGSSTSSAWERFAARATAMSSHAASSSAAEASSATPAGPMSVEKSLDDPSPLPHSAEDVD